MSTKMMLYNSISSCISYFLACLGSCIGCCEKLRPIRIQGQHARKPSISDDYWWSTSTCDLMDNSMLQSQRSYSSIGILNQSFSGSGSTSNLPEFVNQGLLHWSQNRLQWLGTKKPHAHEKAEEPVLSWNESYDNINLVGTSKRFAQPVPLSEMIDFLDDEWDQEGLYER